MTTSIYDTRLLRQKNLSRILKTIRSSAGISRADLSRHFGLSRSSVSSLTEQLFGLGVIEEAHLAASNGGRPPRVLQLKPDCCMVIGVDMGASHITVISMNLGGDIESMLELEMDCCNEPGRVLEKIVELVNQLRKEKPLLGVGVAVASPVVDGYLSERILPAWKKIHLQSSLEQMLGVCVFVGNDANLGAIAERWWGSCQSVENFVFIKMATGVGAGLVQNGRVLTGDRGYAGEIGHIPISQDGLCRCGMKGCLEAHIGLPRLSEYRERVQHQKMVEKENIEHSVLRWLQSEEASVVQNIIDDVAETLSIALSILVNLLNPNKIVLWGPIPQQIPGFVDSLRSSMSSRGLWSPIQKDAIHISVLGAQGIAQGAATLLLEEAFSNPLLFAEMQN